MVILTINYNNNKSIVLLYNVYACAVQLHIYRTSVMATLSSKVNTKVSAAWSQINTAKSLLYSIIWWYSKYQDNIQKF